MCGRVDGCCDTCHRVHRALNPDQYRRVARDDLRARRRARGWSLDNVSRRLGVSAMSVSNWEHGKYRPTPAHLAAWEALLE